MTEFRLDRYRGSGDPISDEEIMEDLRSVAQSEETGILTQRLYSEHGLFDCTTVARRFGSWANAVRRAGLSSGDNRRPQRVSDEELLDDMRRVARRCGSGATVAQKVYGKEGRYAYNTVCRRFGSWNTALQKAGLEISNRVSIPDDELFENILDLWQHYGRQPRRRDLELPPSKFSQGPYNRRFRSWTKALRAFVEHANDTGHEPPPIEESGQSQSSSGDVDMIPSVSAGRQPTDRTPQRQKTPRDPNYRLRYRVLRRDHFSCRSCGASPAKDPNVELQVDHIAPWSKGGETEFENLQCLCSQCNLGKSNR